MPHTTRCICKAKRTRFCFRGAIFVTATASTFTCVVVGVAPNRLNYPSQNSLYATQTIPVTDVVKGVYVTRRINLLELGVELVKKATMVLNLPLANVGAHAARAAVC